MKEEQDYIRDIAEIRSMMERSSRFLSLSGWAGIMAGLYALAGAYVAHTVFQFRPEAIGPDAVASAGGMSRILLLALTILILAIGTAVFLSARKARARRERLWNATARRLLTDMAIPLVAGGLLMLVFFSHGLIGLLAPTSLIFYGLALYNAGKLTYDAVKTLGLIEIGLGLLGAYFISYGLLLWTLGFGVTHVLYGIYIHYKYER